MIRHILMLLALSVSALTMDSSRAEGPEIREWLVPWKKSLPRNPYVDATGRVWFVGVKGHFVANMSPRDGLFNRYDVFPGAGPLDVLVDAERNVWYSGSRKRHIGMLDPSTGQTVTVDMPDRAAKDPHAMAFDRDGNIWFTVYESNFVGRLRTADKSIDLIRVATRKARPDGIVIAPDNTPWVAAGNSNRLLQVLPGTLSIEEISLPDERARPRRLAATSEGDVWYTDPARGVLGRYRPADKQFREWSMPDGGDSRPFGVAADKFDRIWIVETGVTPNRVIGFDTGSETFLDSTDIPSGGGAVEDLHYHEPTGEMWFATGRNYIGRAKVH